MKFLVIAFFCTFGACLAQINPAGLARSQGAGIDADQSKWTPLQCRAGTLGPNDDRMKDVGACAGTHGPGKKNANCVYFCQAKALGLLNNQGLPTTGIYDNWVKNTFPAQHHSVGTAWFRDCYQKYGQHIDLNDADCKMAKRFGDCTWEVQPHLTCPK